MAPASAKYPHNPSTRICCAVWRRKIPEVSSAHMPEIIRYGAGVADRSPDALPSYALSLCLPETSPAFHEKTRMPTRLFSAARHSCLFFMALRCSRQASQRALRRCARLDTARAGGEDIEESGRRMRRRCGEVRRWRGGERRRQRAYESGMPRVAWQHTPRIQAYACFHAQVAEAFHESLTRNICYYHNTLPPNHHHGLIEFDRPPLGLPQETICRPRRPRRQLAATPSPALLIRHVS